MNNFLRWLTVSSENPDKVSATLKGVLIQWVATVLLIAGLVHIPLTQDYVYKLITDITGLFGVFLSLFGIGRKIYYEIVGKKEPILTGTEEAEN